jgi:putative transposase
MTQLYSIGQCSRQGLHQFLARQSRKAYRIDQVIGQGLAIRKKHPNMGCRTMFELMQRINVGRDHCEKILLDSGFRIKRKRNTIKTTHSNVLLKFPDLIKGLSVNGINQVWQSDITYFLTDAKVLFIVFIIDIYSRKIIGWSANDNLEAEANIACLQNAIQTRKLPAFSRLIHHSDRGGQYGAKDYVQLLKQHGIQISMCKQAWQNAYTERVNGTLKNGYLYSWNIQSLSQLRRAVKKAVIAYNGEKPHRGLLGKMSPNAFEQYLLTIPKSDHPVLKIYDYENK